MDNPDKLFLRYLEIARDFSKKNAFLDTAVYSLLLFYSQGILESKKTINKIKYLFFPLYVFYKYSHIKNYLSRGEKIKFPGAQILAIIHGSGPQHYGDLILIINELIKSKKRILISYGTISASQKKYLKSLKNVSLIDQISEAFNISFKEIIKNILLSYTYLKKLLIAVQQQKDLATLFKDNKGFLLDHIFICLCNLNYSKKIIESNHFKIVFSSNDSNFISRGYFINSNQQGIENFMLHHGLGGKKHCKTIASRIVSWSKQEDNYFIDNGFPKERLLSFGLPRFDQMTMENILEENKLESRYKLVDEPKVCFFYSLHSYNVFLPFNKIYIDEINSITPILRKKGIRVFLKAHPSDNIMAYRHILNHDVNDLINIIPSQMSSIEVIKQMDICILPLSAAIIEVVLSNVVAIYVNFDNYWKLMEEYSNLNSIYTGNEIKLRKELYPMIEKLLYNLKYREEVLKRQNDFVQENIFNLGCATRKIQEYILSHTTDILK